MTCADSSSDPGLLLALNGADERLQMALGRMEAGGLTLLAAQEWTVPGCAVRFLAPGIRQMLDGLGLEAGQVRRMACVVGPGSFTGLRMSLALVQGLAAATGAELAGLQHLELLAGEAAQLTQGPWPPWSGRAGDMSMPRLFSAAKTRPRPSGSCRRCPWRPCRSSWPPCPAPQAFWAAACAATWPSSRSWPAATPASSSCPPPGTPRDPPPCWPMPGARPSARAPLSPSICAPRTPRKT
ncbi:MAG: hypothetical protein KJ701_04435 [Proteobacteria bacterium]|nr:hypothetical protein [Pseudomonadota bacterium]